jgi:ribosomal protein L24
MVRVISGPLMEHEGKVVAVKSKTVKIILPSLGYIMVAEVESTNVELIDSSIISHQHPLKKFNNTPS